MRDKTSKQSNRLEMRLNQRYWGQSLNLPTAVPVQMHTVTVCRSTKLTLKTARKSSGSADLQMFLIFMVLTIQGCDLLNPGPRFDRRELAGSESGRRLSVTFIFSCLLDSPARVIKERRAVHSGVVCISACLCAAREGRWENAGGQIFVALLPVSPVWPPT